MAEKTSLIEGAHTLRNVRRDFAEWHQGRSPYVLWALDVDMPAVRARVSRAGAHLAGLLLDAYQRQPHVTLHLCGFPADAPTLPDEFSPGQLAMQCAALRAAKVPAFDIEIGDLASFSSAPFLQVGDPEGHLAQVRACLAVAEADGPAPDYVPHVTVGLYADAWPVSMVGERLADFVAGARLRCRIERISLMGYQPAEVGGVLHRIAAFDLGSGEMSVACV